jgi:Protein of unknown function, DUF547
MKIKLPIILLFITLSSFSQMKAIDHSVWTVLLKKHLNAKGMLNYKGMQADMPKLNTYLDQLSANEPDKKWSINEKLAYWINAYNAFTVKLILDYYDGGKLKSIKDIGTIIPIPRINDGWSKKFIKIGTKTLTLNNIEHDIIRKQFAEPRIHAALVCAAKSCPPLRNEAFLPNILHQQLDDQMSDFINDPSKNSLKPSSVKLSPIFDWYGGDFTKSKPLSDWINKYAKTKLEPNTKITFGDYDWALNDW